MVPIPALFFLLISLRGADCTPDHYTLVTQWPQTVCETFSGDCTVPADVNFWTLSGLWPSRYQGDDPEYCSGADFDPKALQPIKEDMKHLWPNLYANSTNEEFWKHEWDKHGKCSIGDLRNQTVYFGVPVELKLLFMTFAADTYHLLSAGGIKPSDKPVKLTDVTKVLDDFYDIRFNLVCKNDTKTDRFFLYELQLCFIVANDGIYGVDCYIEDDGTTYHVEGCSSDHDVYYLPIER